MELLEGKTAVVTGATSGIGRSIAKTFADHGGDVVVADIEDHPREGGEPTHELIEHSTESRASFVECDVTNYEDLERAVAVADEFGGVDVMVNNAGIWLDETFTEMDETDVDTMIDVNVKGAFFGSQVAVKRMLNRGGGSIINISSVAGIEGGANYVTYSMTKGAVRLMTYALAATFGPQGIRANALHPGPTETQMTAADMSFIGSDRVSDYLETVPARRLAKPTDVANVAAFLASDLAEYVTGESILVDGGNVNTRGIVEDH